MEEQDRTIKGFTSASVLNYHSNHRKPAVRGNDTIFSSKLFNTSVRSVNHSIRLIHTVEITRQQQDIKTSRRHDK